MKAVIRLASLEDCTTISYLAHRIWPVSYAGILTEEQIKNMLHLIYSENSLKNEILSGHQFFIAEQHHYPVGYASAYLEDSVLWLKKLYVLPELQGKGIGKQLLATVIETFPFSQELRLLVNRDNISAQSFYLQQSFEKFGELPVKMGDFNFVDLIFSKSLKSKDD